MRPRHFAAPLPIALVGIVALPEDSIRLRPGYFPATAALAASGTSTEEGAARFDTRRPS
jgi:hypothetical protein